MGEILDWVCAICVGGEMARFGSGLGWNGRVGEEVGAGEYGKIAKVFSRPRGVEWWGREGATSSGCGAGP